jgi:hypothetical protein
MIEIHTEALENRLASYHEFLARYSKRTKTVYGFVEGKEDPSFYRGFIDLLIPDDWQVELWPAGNKKQVYEIHRLINWRRFSKKRICFFVDKDLGAILPQNLGKDSNIYVTSGYSIENDVVKKEVFKRVLIELFGLSATPHSELEKAEQIFEVEIEKFCRCLIPVMAWIVYWKQNGKRPGLNDIQMKDLFEFAGCSIQQIQRPKGKPDLVTYIHEQCNIAIDVMADIGPLVKWFSTKNRYRLYARGKYLLWFLVEICHSIHKEAIAVFPSVTKIPKKNVALSSSNGMQIIGPRARIPRSLRIFLSSTYSSYILRNDAGLRLAR